MHKQYKPHTEEPCQNRNDSAEITALQKNTIALFKKQLAALNFIKDNDKLCVEEKLQAFKKFLEENQKILEQQKQEIDKQKKKRFLKILLRKACIAPLGCTPGRQINYSLHQKNKTNLDLVANTMFGEDALECVETHYKLKNPLFKYNTEKSVLMSEKLRNLFKKFFVTEALQIFMDNRDHCTFAQLKESVYLNMHKISEKTQHFFTKHKAWSLALDVIETSQRIFPLEGLIISHTEKQTKHLARSTYWARLSAVTLINREEDLDHCCDSISREIFNLISSAKALLKAHPAEERRLTIPLSRSFPTKRPEAELPSVPCKKRHSHQEPSPPPPPCKKRCDQNSLTILSSNNVPTDITEDLDRCFDYISREIFDLISSVQALLKAHPAEERRLTIPLSRSFPTKRPEAELPSVPCKKRHSHQEPSPPPPPCKKRCDQDSLTTLSSNNVVKPQLARDAPMELN